MTRCESCLPSLLLIFACCTVTFCIFIEPYIPAPLPPCSDYEMLIVNSRRCVSRCPIACVNGVCFENGTCPCDGFYQRNVSISLSLVCVQQCLTGCAEAGGYCAGPDLCICPHGLIFDAVSRRCVLNSNPIDLCFGRCKYGTCVNGNCTCAQGFIRNGTLLGQVCVPTCTQNCGLRGYCFLPNMCTCRGKHWHYDKDGVCHKDVLVFGK